MSTLSIKERILRQLVKNIKNMNIDDNNGIDFDFVTREELDEERQNSGRSIAILDGEENFTYQTSYLQCTMQVGMDYAVALKKGDTPSYLLGAILAELKKVILSNIHLIEDDTNLQLCQNIQIRDYFPDRAGPNDDVATAFVSFDFIYRENKENPYTYM